MSEVGHDGVLEALKHCMNWEGSQTNRHLPSCGHARGRVVAEEDGRRRGRGAMVGISFFSECTFG